MFLYKVSIVIPTLNEKKLLEKHLPKVIIASEGAEIIVVDDVSNDGSVDFIKNKFPNIQVITNQVHQGFAKCINQGVNRAKGNIVILLNSDVVPKKGFLAPLLSSFSDEKLFAAGCLEYSTENGKKTLTGRGEACWKYGMYLNRQNKTDKVDTAWVSAGSGAFRKDIWHKLGGLDPLFYPLYWEDVDICYRAQKTGYKLVFNPKSKVFHNHDKGTVAKYYSKEQKREISIKNKYLFVWKNLSDKIIFLEHLVFVPIRLLRALIAFDTTYIKGFICALLQLPQIINTRREMKKYWKVPDINLSVWDK